MVTVCCLKCGARYETSLPAPSVRRVARCPTCGLRTLEVVDDRDAADRVGEHATDEARD